jgi:hypothetical protein
LIVSIIGAAALEVGSVGAESGKEYYRLQSKSSRFISGIWQFLRVWRSFTSDRCFGVSVFRCGERVGRFARVLSLLYYRPTETPAAPAVPKHRPAPAVPKHRPRSGTETPAPAAHHHFCQSGATETARSHLESPPQAPKAAEPSPRPFCVAKVDAKDLECSKRQQKGTCRSRSHRLIREENSL